MKNHWFKNSEREMINNKARSEGSRFSVLRGDKIRFTNRRPRLAYASTSTAWDNRMNEEVPRAKLQKATNRPS